MPDARVAAAPDDPPPRAETVRVEVNDKLFTVRFLDIPKAPPDARRKTVPRAPAARAARSNGVRAGGSNDVVSPMHGVVVELTVEAGTEVAQGQVVAVVEAMKMMNEILAPRAGSVGAVHTAVGATVEAQAPLLTLA